MGNNPNQKNQVSSRIAALVYQFALICYQINSNTTELQKKIWTGY